MSVVRKGLKTAMYSIYSCFPVVVNSASQKLDDATVFSHVTKFNLI